MLVHLVQEVIGREEVAITRTAGEVEDAAEPRTAWSLLCQAQLSLAELLALKKACMA